MQPLTITVVGVSETEYRRSRLFVSQREFRQSPAFKWYVSVPGIILVLAMQAVSNRYFTYGLLVSFVVVLLCEVLRQRAAASAGYASAQRSYPMTLEIDDSGIQVSTPSFSSAYSWSAFDFAEVNGTRLIIGLRSGQTFVVPDRALPAGPADLAEVLRRQAAFATWPPPTLRDKLIAGI